MGIGSIAISGAYRESRVAAVRLKKKLMLWRAGAPCASIASERIGISSITPRRMNMVICYWFWRATRHRYSMVFGFFSTR